jgi:DNA-binding CsgD family transcriptional regulator
MSAGEQITAMESLSERLLRLGRLAREVPAAQFLGRAVALLREAVPFRRGWWGLATRRDKGRPASIYQAEYIDLPADFAAAWHGIATVDDFATDLRDHIGEVRRFCDADPAPPEVMAFDERFKLHQGMGLMLDDASTGHVFFIVVYRDRRQARFGDGEAMLFQHLVRHTLQHWHHALQDALSSASKHGIAGAALARMDGAVLYAGPQLCEMLYTQWPAWDGITLPAEVVQRFGALPCSLRLPGGTIDISQRDQHVWLVRAGAGEVNPLALLSPRERRVAHLFADGHSYKEIARLAAVTPATVRTYLRSAYLQLGVRNKVQLGDVLGRAAAR